MALASGVVCSLPVTCSRIWPPPIWVHQLAEASGLPQSYRRDGCLLGGLSEGKRLQRFDLEMVTKSDITDAKPNVVSAKRRILFPSTWPYS